VFDRHSPLSKRALAEFVKKNVHEKLFRYAVWRTSSEADAEDLLADAIECVGDPDRKPWDPEKGSFFRHMRLVMDTLAIDRARSGHARFEVVNSSLAINEETMDPAPVPDKALHDARKLAWWRRLGDLLLEKVSARDPLAKSVFLAACEGAETPNEQAAKIGCTVAEVYEAQRRLKYHGACILAQDREAEAARMKALRASAKKRETK
jgi:DNA-directed RNA polymerase specialized sigma24 family protein